MTTVDSTGPSASLLAAMNPATKTATSEAAAAQDKFMTLLVTQMKNQDPLNPMDNAQLTSQLAQLSTVTGIDKLNATVESLKGSYQSSQTLQAASMIGHGVLVPGSGVDLLEGKAYMGVEMTEPADSVKVNVLDGSGKKVRTIDMGAQGIGIHPMSWDGKTDAGVAAPDGKYKFEVVAARGADSVKTTALAFDAVASVSSGTQGVKLNLSNAGPVDLTDIRQIL